MTHPYADLPDRAFWSNGVIRTDRQRMPGLYTPRVPITHSTAIATAGSCFAQHIGRTLGTSGCNVLDAEPAPAAMPDSIANRYGYRLFSGRYGNIYTSRQLRQFLKEVADGAAQSRFIWHNDGRYRDAFRPTVEPGGLDTPEEVLLHRDYHLEKTSQMLRNADVFIFTLGLTEGWEDIDTGRIFPLCPGVAGGTFDARQHRFRNLRHTDVVDDLHAIHRTLKRFNPAMALVLTISPVPLTATATGNHVLNATSASKSTLRAAVAEFIEDTTNTDYVPSYEIVTQQACGGPWFGPDMRQVSPQGITHVMELFCAAHGLIDDGPATITGPDLSDNASDDICDEILLDAFAR